MALNVNMSLDDIISSNKTSFSFTGDKMRGSGGNRGRRGANRTQERSGRDSTRTQFSRGNVNGNWSHDMYSGGPSRKPIAPSRPTFTNAKLEISNLDFEVSESDIRELFSDFGPMKSSAIHYDRSGRSMGTATVFFVNKFDATRALEKYNGVHLDGQPMSIRYAPGEWKNYSNSRPFAAEGITKRLGGVRQMSREGNSWTRGGNRGRGFRERSSRGAVRGRQGGRPGNSEKAPTSEELDAELDAYIVEANKIS